MEVCRPLHSPKRSNSLVLTVVTPFNQFSAFNTESIPIPSTSKLDGRVKKASVVKKIEHPSYERFMIDHFFGKFVRDSDCVHCCTCMVLKSIL